MYFRFSRSSSSRYLFLNHTKIIKAVNLRYSTTIEEPQQCPKRKDVALDGAYVPSEVEANWYEWWESQNFFKPNPSSKRNFTIALPPPNITGTLHLGHALTATVQDVLVRWKRMKGESVLWVPGIDHAGIATQVVVEKKIRKESSISRVELGKEKFLDEVWEWKHLKSEKIVEQLKRLGCSLDWSKTVFTMDDDHSNAVLKAFIRLFDDGLIYRAESLVNWSCSLNSSISDIEVTWEELKGPTSIHIPGYQKPVQFGVIIDFAYKIFDEDGEIVVSTTRPETMLGDVAIAVNPKDDRYAHLEGKFAWHPFRRCKIPIIFDDMVDLTFGTGAVKITPAHDPTDFKVGLKNDLEAIPVFDERGNTNSIGCVKKFHNVPRFELKKHIIDELNAMGLLRAVRDHPMRLPLCSRSGDVIEFLSRPQWFVNCKGLAEKAAEAVKSKALRIEPENFESQWFHWLENIRDWNISRQLWWGHRIPVYDCTSADKRMWVAAVDADEAVVKAATQMKSEPADVTVEQDTDVLDTWFSSALLPLSAVGWPNNKASFESRYPLTLMETGHDILFFWVARMVMLDTYLTDKLPFKHVLLHSVLCDSKGRKMSKSTGNVINPESVINGATLTELNEQAKAGYDSGLLTKAEMEKSISEQKRMYPNGIPECGSDALRFTLLSSNTSGHFMNFDLVGCISSKLFCNKIFQAVKYLRISLKTLPEPSSISLKDQQMTIMDRWILSRLAFCVKQVESALSYHQFHLATRTIRSFLYSEFCDVYLESSKLLLKSDSRATRQASIAVLFNCLETSLRLISPFMPFLSEQLYQSLPKLKGFQPKESITIASYPMLSEWILWHDCEIDSRIDRVLDAIAGFRRLKNIYGLPRQEKPNGFIACKDSYETDFEGLLETISHLCSVGKLDIIKHHVVGEQVIEEQIREECTVYLVHDMDRNTLLQKLSPQLNKENQLQKSLERLTELMSKENYNEKTAPDDRAKDMNRVKQLELDLKKIRDLKRRLQLLES